MTAEELCAVEDAVNEQILANTEAETFEMSLDDAKHMGAMALFGEKYSDHVRVVAVPGFSVELCGGTHVTRTGDIGLFRIQSEAGIAAGVRRIEAQTGAGALSYIREQADLITLASSRLKTSPDRLIGSIDKLQEEKRQVDRELSQARAELAKAAAGDLASQVIKMGDVSVLITQFDGDLREQADTLRDQLGSAVVVLASSEDGKVKLIAAATKDVTGKIHAGKLIQELAPMVGGRGGGRPDLAQAGGSDASGIDAALAHAKTWIQERLA
jgi:alanyl-tRNA synthetase